MLRSIVRSSRVVSSILLAFTAGTVRAQSTLDTEDTPRIEEVSFQGVQAADAGDLQAAIFTEPTACKSLVFKPFCWVTSSGIFVEKHYLDLEELERDELRIRILYYRLGYRDAQVVSSVRPSDGGVEVEFMVEEGPATRVRSFDLRQTEPVLDTDETAAAKPPAQGARVNLYALDSLQVQLLEVLQDRGYADAEVRDTVRVVSDGLVADVDVTIEPGAKARIEAIEVRGNEKVSDRTIRRSIGLQPGDLYRRDELLTSQRRLYRSNLFLESQVTVPETADSTKTIVVTVREAPLRAFRTGFGFNTSDFVQAEIGFTRYNWFGGARRLDLRAALGNLLAPQLNGVGFFHDYELNSPGTDEEEAFLDPTWQVGAELTQPWFLSPRNSLGTGLFAHRRSVPPIVIDDGFGASASFTRRLTEEIPLSVEYRFEISSIEAGDVYYCVNYGVCGRPTIAALRESQRLSPLRLALLVERTDDPLFPRSGMNARAEFEHASGVTASDFRYNRASAEVSRYFAVGPGVLAGRVRGGWIRPLDSSAAALGVTSDGDEDGILHPRKRFYAGGSRSVRGFSENQLGPRVLTIAADELEAAGGVEACVEGSAGCDLGAISAKEFRPRPVGGTTLLEASLEYRFPLFGQIGGAVFVDAGSVGAQGGELPATTRSSAVTPGFGIRYASPVGPIRVDLGIRPTLTEELTVITEVTGDDGTRLIVDLGRTTFDPLQESSGFRRVLNRLMLHLSIGEAF
ncbi:N/A [soil metagenome]